MIHLSPLEVLRSDKYKIFMKMFGADCEHILVNNQLKITDENPEYIEKFHSR